MIWNEFKVNVLVLNKQTRSRWNRGLFTYLCNKKELVVSADSTCLASPRLALPSLASPAERQSVFGLAADVDVCQLATAGKPDSVIVSRLQGVANIGKNTGEIFPGSSILAMSKFPVF